MKQLLTIALSTALFTALLPATSFAEDNVSVTVNGQTFSCSGNGGEGAGNFACKCDQDSNAAQLNYYKIDRSTGTSQFIRSLGFWNLGSWPESLKVCNENKATEVVCQGL